MGQPEFLTSIGESVRRFSDVALRADQRLRDDSEIANDDARIARDVELTAQNDGLPRPKTILDALGSAGDAHASVAQPHCPSTRASEPDAIASFNSHLRVAGCR
jgi:hypothetical protein